MVRSLRSLDGESRIVHRESWGRGDTRLDSGERFRPHVAPPRRFLISPSSRLSVSPFPRLLRSRPRRLFLSSIHRHPPTTRPPSHRHEHPLHPGTTNPLHPLFLSFSLWRRDARTGASTLVSASAPTSPHLAVSPGTTSSSLPLIDSSAPTTTRPPSHRHEHPLHPSTTNPPHPLFLSFSLWRRDARTGASTLVSAPHPHSPRLAGDLAAVLDLVHRQIDTEAHRAFIDRLG